MTLLQKHASLSSLLEHIPPHLGLSPQSQPASKQTSPPLSPPKRHLKKSQDSSQPSDDLTPPEGYSSETFQKAVALCLALGLSTAQASKFLNVKPLDLERFKQTSKAADLANELQVAVSYSPEQRIAASVTHVLDRKIKILHTSKDDRLVNAVGTEILERQFGKAIQMTQSVSVSLTQNSSVEEVDAKMNAAMARLKQLEANQKRLIHSTSNVEVEGEVL